MDLQIDRAALQRRQSTQLALRVLEAAIEQALGFTVQIQNLGLWASPAVFEEGRVPERFIRLTPSMELLDAQMQALLQEPTPLEQIPTAKEMIARRKARKS